MTSRQGQASALAPDALVGEAGALPGGALEQVAGVHDLT